MIELNVAALDAAADAMSEASESATDGRDAARRVVEAYLTALGAVEASVPIEACADIADLLAWVPAVEADGPTSYTRSVRYARALRRVAKGEGWPR